MFSLKVSRPDFRTAGLALIILSFTAWTAAGTGFASAQTLTTLTSFDGTHGANPWAGLIDRDGNLFGTTVNYGAYGGGTVFELVKTSSGYAATPTTLVDFNGTNGAEPAAALLADASGNLFGTTFVGGTANVGTVFEIVKTSSGYASTPTTLVNFNGTNGAFPFGGLIADASGNLFGTTQEGGATGYGTVFEIVRTSTGYASTPTTLVSFSYTNGAQPLCTLIADSNGNLFGTTSAGGASGQGTVFEIARTSSGYASTPTTLANFNGTNGAQPYGGLLVDATGNLLGTTFLGGTASDGTVFEIVRTSSGYASTPITLVNFNGANGSEPLGSLIADAVGNLFGTTYSGGTANAGTTFEVVRASSGYLSTPVTLVNFNGTNGSVPVAGLLADPSGNIFGTTSQGGAAYNGTVFEVTGSGYVPAIPFASFQAGLALSTRQPFGFVLSAAFTTSAANTAVNPATQAVTLAIANYTLAIPAGSFHAFGSAYVYQGTVGGVTISAALTPLSRNAYLFAATAWPVNLAATTNPVPVRLTIGANAGASQVNALRLP